MLSLERRGRIWQAVGQVNGRRIHQSLKTADRTVALTLLRDLETQILSGGRVRRILWPDFAEEFERWIETNVKPSTLKVYRGAVKRFGKFCEEQRILELSAVNPTIITEYTEQRKKDRHPTRNTLITAEGIKADLRILHRVFAYAVDCGYLAPNPIRYSRLSTVGGKTLPFSRAEVRLMLDADEEPEMRAILLTFLLTGLRISDVRALRKDCVDLDAGVIRLHTQKRGNAVTLAIHPELKVALEAHFTDCNANQALSELVFSTASGRPLTALDSKLRRLWFRLGIEHGHAHRFRDTFAVNLLASGATLYDVAKLLGITMAIAEEHYAPYVQELQDRATRLISQMTLPGQDKGIAELERLYDLGPDGTA